jgi:hypothetical protein
MDRTSPRLTALFTIAIAYPYSHWHTQTHHDQDTFYVTVDYVYDGCPFDVVHIPIFI